MLRIATAARRPHGDDADADPETNTHTHTHTKQELRNGGEWEKGAEKDIVFVLLGRVAIITVVVVAAAAVVVVLAVVVDDDDDGDVHPRLKLNSSSPRLLASHNFSLPTLNARSL